MSKVFWRAALVAAGGLLVVVSVSAGTYRSAGETVDRTIAALPLPRVDLSPDRKWLLLTQLHGAPDVEVFREPSVSFAGYDFNPQTMGYHPGYTWNIGLTLVDPRSGRRWEISAPGERIGDPLWSPDSRRFVFIRAARTDAELWIADIETKRARKVTTAALSATKPLLRQSCVWTSDSSSVVCHGVVADRGPLPSAGDFIVGPAVEESRGVRTATWARNNLLRNADDVALFDYFLSTQPLLIDVATGESRLLAKPAMYDYWDLSPDGQYLLTVRKAHPYSFVESANFFPQTFEVIDVRDGKARTLHQRGPSSWSSVAEGASPPGKRRHAWIPALPATLMYVEALDGGALESDLPHRDRLMRWDAPFDGDAMEVMRTRGRLIALPETTRQTWQSDFARLTWLSRSAWIEELDYRQSRKRIWHWRVGKSSHDDVQLIFDVALKDGKTDPGRPLLAGGTEEINPTALQGGDWIYLTGAGASATGNRPFVDRFNVRTHRKQRLYTSGEGVTEQVEALLDEHTFVVRREAPLQPANYYIRDVRADTTAALTNIDHAVAGLRDIKPTLIQYVREDGVPLSGSLYLPQRAEDRKVPVVIWAYPVSFSSAQAAARAHSTAGTYIWDANDPLRLATCLLVQEGFGVLWYASMPVIGDSRANDTAVEQMVASARAAVDKLVEIGVTDRSMIAIAGHSYGGAMAATLLAHSDLFAAGIAIGGRYNWTSVPTGFQDEGRTYWQARDAYLQLSPLLHADRIRAPLLIVHCDDDLTVPVEEARRLYQGLNVLGKQARLVLLPFEGHVPHARQTVGHLHYEMAAWLSKHLLKRSPSAAAQKPLDSR